MTEEPQETLNPRLRAFEVTTKFWLYGLGVLIVLSLLLGPILSVGYVFPIASLAMALNCVLIAHIRIPDDPVALAYGASAASAGVSAVVGLVVANVAWAGIW